MQHVRGLHVGEGPEHREQLRQIDEFREPRVHAVARAVRREFERRDRLAEIGGPGVEMLDARGFERLRREIALQRVHLGHGVRDRRAGGKDDAAIALGQIARLHVHIEGAVALGIGQARRCASSSR